MLDVSLPTNPVSSKVKTYAKKIAAAWQTAVDGILSVAALLKEAEENLNPIEQMDLYGELPFSKSTADKLLAIGADARLNDPTYREYLPAHWTTLYEMTQLDDKTFKAGINDGLINPAVERRMILELAGQKLVPALVAVKNTQSVIQQTSDTAQLATISVPKGFDISQVGTFQREIEKLVLAYGGEVKFDKSKKGVIGRQREALSLWCIGELEERKKGYAKTPLTKIELLETTISQLKRDSNGKPLLDYKKDPNTGAFVKNDIRNPSHPYHGKTLKNIYDEIRSQKILTQHSGLKEIDKEAHCLDLLRQHSQGNARSRSDALVKLSRMVSRGDVDTQRFATDALDKIIEG
jgi:hypothetical protein